MSKNYTKEQVEEAIKGSVGIMSTIAKRLDCNWRIAKKYCGKWECTRQALANENESIIDLAESKAFSLIKEGDAGMIKWFLSRKGKNRGYTERQEITGAGGGPIQTSGTLTIIEYNDAD